MSIESISSIVSIPDGKLVASVVSFETCESKDASRQKYTVNKTFDSIKKTEINEFHLKLKTFKVEVKLGSQSWFIERRYNEFDRLNLEVNIKLLKSSRGMLNQLHLLVLHVFLTIQIHLFFKKIFLTRGKGITRRKFRT